MAMNVWRCLGCQELYRIRLSRCPRCHRGDFEEEAYMPKITVHGGPTNAADPAPAVELHPGIDEPMEAVDVPADGSEHELVAGYEAWTVATLQDELRRRNEGRDEPLPLTGRKQDLVDRLVADDTAAAELAVVEGEQPTPAVGDAG